ncbi:MAG: YfhO family protein [Acidobacteria bacterium]|nr:YfhO family protein [Acidobacteriota bacterium]
MTLVRRRGDALVLGLLALLPVLAHAPAWWESRLLGPGDGAALHYPLRVLVWESYRRGELPSWNPTIFCGTPLLAAYRPAAFFPTVAVATLLPPFAAFQALVLASLSLSGILVFLYLRRLGAGIVGAYVSGLAFPLGPYLVGHLGDTATLGAAPLLPLALLAAEAYVRRGSAGRAAGLAAVVALLLLSGSPEVVRAGGALLAGRLLVGHLFPPRGRRLRWPETVVLLVAGALLAAPQVLPTFLAAREAGRQITGLAPAGQEPLPGVTGLILRYVSHTPAPSLALAALPLALTETPVRVLGVALALCLGLQWGRGPLAAPGAAALVFDLGLAVLAGLSLSAQWEVRREALGRRLRAYFLFSCLASAAALSVSAALLEPLPQTLAGAVGVLALSLILYFSLAASPDPVKAGVWLLPLTVSFLLQPHGRQIWSAAPTRDEIARGTPNREAVDRVMGARRGERTLTLAREWPREEANDLAYANLGALVGRRTANGYDPMVPLRHRMAFDGMSVGGTLPGAFFRTAATRLEALGIQWVQVPATGLTTQPDSQGYGDTLDLPVEAGHPRFFSVPVAAATELRVASLMSDAVGLVQDQPVARLQLRLASGRELELFVRAGVHTGEWAYDRPDVRAVVRHSRPPILESWPGPGGGFEGHRYHGVVPLPARYYVDGLWVERLPGPGRLILTRLAFHDGSSNRSTPLSLASAYAGDTAHLREAVATLAVRLFDVPRSLGRARVVERLRFLPDDEAVLKALRQPFDPWREALAVETEAVGVTLAGGARTSRAEVTRAAGGRIDLQAEGPGLLVVTEAWDPGWTAVVDGAATRLVRVNHLLMGLALGEGFHRVALRHRPAGFRSGLLLAGLGAALLAARMRRPS